MPPPLLALSPGTLQLGPGGDARAATGAFERAARAAIGAGVSGILLREPALEDGAFLDLARRLRLALDEQHGAGWLGLHDRLHLVGACGADGAHVGGRSLPAPAARRVVGEAVTLGVSTHAGDDASIWTGADIVLHAPVFAPRSKAASSAPLGTAGLAAFVSSCPLPVWGVGGLTADSIAELVGTGAAGACTIGALWGTDEAPIQDDSSALGDLDRIARRARGLVAAAERTFARAER